jgi:hypothetical protein
MAACTITISIVGTRKSRVTRMPLNKSTYLS